MHFSVLDRANTVAGVRESETLRGVIEHARDVEKLGFTRFLVAEHHAVPGIAGSQPTLLAAAVASATETIRVGTAGIMLPNHQPLIAAEQIATLEALYPGRIDAGIGNSVGFTAPVRDALRQGDPTELKNRFADDLAEMLSFLEGSAGVTMQPENGARTPIWLLAGFRSLKTAADLGIGTIVGGPSLMDTDKPAHEGLEYYRTHFQPSAFNSEPRATISLDIGVADTEKAARDLVLPEIWAGVRSRSTGAFPGLQPAADLDPTTLTAQERKRVANGLSSTIYGTPQQVRERLKEIVRFTGVDEIVVTGGMADAEGRASSEELLAELM